MKIGTYWKGTCSLCLSSAASVEATQSRRKHTVPFIRVVIVGTLLYLLEVGFMTYEFLGSADGMFDIDFTKRESPSSEGLFNELLRECKEER